MAQRSPEDVLAGVLRVPVGGVEKLVPTLKIRAVRAWQAVVAEKVGPIPALLGNQSAGTVEGMFTFTGLAIEAILDLVVAYDSTGALGGREWLEANADPAQLYAAARQMGEVTFPFVGDVGTLMLTFPALFRSQAKPAEPSDSTSSTNGPSPSGASTPEPSKSGSTRTS